jgi:hypothetical protein
MNVKYTLVFFGLQWKCVIETRVICLLSSSRHPPSARISKDLTNAQGEERVRVVREYSGSDHVNKN